jgi:Skp family chaperone for outer membrane proteins
MGMKSLETKLIILAIIVIAVIQVAYVNKKINVAVASMSADLSEKTKVAVLDMDRVFKDVGMMQKMEDARRKSETYVKATQALKAYTSSSRTHHDELAAAKTAIEKENIKARILAEDKQFNENITPLQQAIQKFDNLAVASFKKRLDKFVAEVAMNDGVEVVLTKSTSISYIKNKIDITDEVVKASREFFAKDMPLIEPTLNESMTAR